MTSIMHATISERVYTMAQNITHLDITEKKNIKLRTPSSTDANHD